MSFAKITLSKAIIPPHRRHVRQVAAAGFELMAFINEDVGRRIWLTGKFEPDETDFFSAMLRPGDVCFDVGGNVGYMSMLFASKASEGHVHVFEPIALNALLIEANAKLNGFKNLTINNVAVGQEDGRVKFSVSSDSAYSSMLATGRSQEVEQVDVAMVSLDGYVDRHNLQRVDILKVDVEGAEPLVIAGGSRLLSNENARPRLVLLELFDKNLKPFNSSVLNLVKKMQDFGYSACVLRNGELQPFTAEIANVEPNIFFTTKRA